MVDETLVKCPSCNGSGEQATSHVYTCPDCRGKGRVTPELRAALLAKEKAIYGDGR